MSIITELQEQLETTQTAAFVTTMLRDISANRLQAIRRIFEANEAYYNELHRLTELITAYAEREQIELPTATGSGEVFIAVTSNKRFYGSVNNEVMDLFLTLLKRPGTTGVIIGTTGKQYAALHQLEGVAASFVFTTDEPTPEELFQVIEAVTTYGSVQVVHPTFINSFRQEATVTDLTHRVTESGKTTVTTDAGTIDYICEPELPEMYRFFTTQIRTVLLARALLETRVALTAARLMKMQRARERATKQVKEERRHIHREITTIKNLRLLETFAGFNSDRSI